MESWKNGRRDLLDQLTEICDRIDQDLASELNEENTVRIKYEELRLLRENSERADKLVEQNAYLEEELGRCRKASAMVGGLEKENKQLAGELAQKLKQQRQEIGTPRLQAQAGTGPRSTPAHADPSCSTARTDIDELNASAIKERYQSLVAKYNNLSDKYLELKDARQILENALRVKVERIKLWDAWKKDQDEAACKKNDKIQRLQEEIQKLRAQANGGRGLSLAPVPRPDGVDADETEDEVTRAVQVPKTSPLRGLQGVTATDQHGITGNRPKSAKSSADQDSLDTEEPDLPAHRGAAGTHINDTQFEEVEIHNASSTEGSDLLSPSKVGGHEQAEEPTSARSSSPVVEFVSARSVKKRKTFHDRQSRKPKTKIKLETISSSPIGLVRLQYLKPNESLDLDDIGEKIDTPKKQRRVIELTSPDSISVSLPPLALKLQSQIKSQNECHNIAIEGEEPGNTSQETPPRRSDSILQPRSTNRQILPRTSENRVPKKRRIANDEAVGELIEDGEIEAAAMKPRRQATNTNDRLNGMLAKPSPPRQVLSPRQAWASNQQPRPARTPVTSGLAQQLKRSREADWMTPTGMLAKFFPQSSRSLSRESAEASRPSSKCSSHSGCAEPIMPSSRTLLREPAERSRPTSNGTPRGSAEPSRPISGRPVPQHPESGEGTFLPPKRLPLTLAYLARASSRTIAEIPRPTSQKPAEPKKTASNISGRPGRDIGESGWEMDPDQEPLRARPLSRLNLNDFKVNPNYNQGYDYAFQETVRGRDARQKCLQGCTKHECCGRKFRVLAEMDREVRGPPTLSQEEADELLLEEYLGDNAYRIRNMSNAQKEEMLLQARTRELANKLGRHRHAYERRTTPPGFWRPDFPTTQEEREDREKANEITRSHVEERYKEAMRPNGRFLFRDE